MATNFVALALQNGLEYYIVDGQISSGDEPSTSYRNLVSFGPVTPNIFEGRNFFFWDDTAKSGISNRIFQNILDQYVQSSPNFQN